MPTELTFFIFFCQILAKTQKIYYLCNIFTPMALGNLYEETVPGKPQHTAVCRKWCGEDTIYGKGVYHALCSLTIWKRRKLLLQSRDSATITSMGSYINDPYCSRMAIAAYAIVSVTCMGCFIYVSAWRFWVARFDCNGQFLRPQIVERARICSPRLFNSS